MKASREIKRYIARNRDRLTAIHWDDLVISIKQYTCKKNFKRNKRVTDDLHLS